MNPTLQLEGSSYPTNPNNAILHTKYIDLHGSYIFYIYVKAQL